jgi:HEAT repeat protein
LALAASLAWADAVEDLRSPDPRRRAEAAEALGKLNDSQHIPALRPLVQDPDRKVRAEVVAAIVAIGTQHSLEPLIQATRDSEPAIQILALDGLVNFYYPGYVQTGWTSTLKRFGTGIKGRFTEINTLVIDPYIEVSAAVTEAIGRVAVGGASMESRALAARALGILRARAEIPRLQDTFRSKDTQVILESLRALEKIGDRAAGPGIAFLLRDLDEGVQVAAIDATGQLQNREAIPALVEVFENAGRSRVRQAALVALAKMPAPPNRELFLRYLGDRDKYLRAAAAEGIGRSGQPGDLERLKKSFTAERDQSPRLSLAFALVHLGDSSYLPYLLDALNSAVHRGEARPFLVELARKPDVLAQLYKPLRSGSREQKKNLSQVMAASGTADSLPHLEELSRDPDIEVAREALNAAKSLKARL